MRLPVAILVAAACGHPPPAKPTPAERPVSTIADLAGNWVASDDLDWSYALSIVAGGSLVLDIDRVKMGRCHERATVVPGAAPRTFELTYEVNECHRELAGTRVEMKVASFTGDSLTIVLADEKRAFTRRAGQ